MLRWPLVVDLPTDDVVRTSHLEEVQCVPGEGLRLVVGVVHCGSVTNISGYPPFTLKIGSATQCEFCVSQCSETLLNFNAKS